MDGENDGKNPIKMDDLGVPLFSEISIWGNPFKSLVVYTLLYSPKDPFVCPKDPGIPRTIPMTRGWDGNRPSILRIFRRILDSKGESTF